MIEGCIRKDKRSWDAFVGRYSKVVYWAVRDRLKRLGYEFEEEDINDIHQDVFIALWAGDKLRQLRDREKVAGWLAMVAGNAAISHFRKMKRQSPPNSISIYEEIYRDGGGKSLEEILPSGAPGADKEAQRREAVGLVNAAVESLAPKEKMIVKMNFFHGMTYGEIAGALKMTENAVTLTMSRVKKYMKGKLGDERLL